MNSFFEDFGYSVRRDSYGGNSLWIAYEGEDGSNVESVVFAERSKQTGEIDFGNLRLCVQLSTHGDGTSVKERIFANGMPPEKVLSPVLETSVAANFYRLPKCD